jgi:hypothetical protein
MYLNSVHTYADKKGGCSIITRHVEQKAIDAIDAIYSKDSQGSKIAQLRRNTRVAMKDEKIKELPIPAMRPETNAEMLEIIAQKKTPRLKVIVSDGSTIEFPPLKMKKPTATSLYIAGGTTEELLRDFSPFPKFSTSWSVRERFQVFDNNAGTGCRVSGLFTLFPREWVKKVFDETNIDQLAVPSGGFFVATVVVVVFKIVFNDWLVVPCGGFFVATVDFVVFEIVFNDRLVIPCNAFLLRQSILSSSKLSSMIGLSFLVADSSL